MFAFRIHDLFCFPVGVIQRKIFQTLRYSFTREGGEQRQFENEHCLGSPSTREEELCHVILQPEFQAM